MGSRNGLIERFYTLLSRSTPLFKRLHMQLSLSYAYSVIYIYIYSSLSVGSFVRWLKVVSTKTGSILIKICIPVRASNHHCQAYWWAPLNLNFAAMNANVYEFNPSFTNVSLGIIHPLIGEANENNQNHQPEWYSHGHQQCLLIVEWYPKNVSRIPLRALCTHQLYPAYMANLRYPTCLNHFESVYRTIHQSVSPDIKILSQSVSQSPISCFMLTSQFLS